MDITYKCGSDSMDYKRVTEMLSQAYWSIGIKEDEMKKAALNSALVIRAFSEEGRQIAYGRVISDKTRFAYWLTFTLIGISGIGHLPKDGRTRPGPSGPGRCLPMAPCGPETRTGSTRNADSRSSHVLRILWRYGVPVRRTDDGYTLRGGMRSLRRLNTPGGTISFIAPPNWKASLIPLLERYEYLASVTMKKVSISGASCLFI